MTVICTVSSKPMVLTELFKIIGKWLSWVAKGYATCPRKVSTLASAEFSNIKFLYLKPSENLVGSGVPRDQTHSANCCGNAVKAGQTAFQNWHREEAEPCSSHAPGARKHPFQFSEAAGVEILSKGTGGPSVLHSCIVLGPRGPDGEGAAAALFERVGPGEGGGRCREGGGTE